MIRRAYLRTRYPAAQEPIPSPAMKLESTIEIMAVVTPNCAMARRSQTNSYRMLQNPETMKKAKYQFHPTAATGGSSVRRARGFAVRIFIVLDIVSVLTGYSFRAGMPEPSA